MPLPLDGERFYLRLVPILLLAKSHGLPSLS